MSDYTFQIDHIDFDQLKHFQQLRETPERTLETRWQECAHQFRSLRESSRWSALADFPPLSHYQQQEESLLAIRNITGCSTDEVQAFLKIYGFPIDILYAHVQDYGDFSPIRGYSYTMCLHCHNRQWFLTKNEKPPCPYCGLFDWMDIEIGEPVSFQPGIFDIAF
jgi:hypothetical protein